MPRSPRVEFEGAVYHVMARGNRREPIVFDQADRTMFVETFGEAAVMTGWEVFAWVLMDNHYHAVFCTPHGNLVDGMKWFQNTFTRRINCRHQLWGHLFGGRYRSILIENRDYGGAVWRDYLRTAIDYVHLNPGRARLVDGVEKSCAEYKWSSLASAYTLPPSKRPGWMAVGEVLDLFQEKDTAAGRRSYMKHLDERIQEEAGFSPKVEGNDFEDRLKRGWYWGSEAFKDAVLSIYEKRLAAGKGGKGNAVHRGSGLVKDHAEQSARRILGAARNHFGLSDENLKKMVKGDYTRASIAYRLHMETTMNQSWIAEQLGMKSAANVSRQIRVFKKQEQTSLPKSIRQWFKIKNL